MSQRCCEYILDNDLKKQCVREMVVRMTGDGKSSGNRKGLTTDGILKTLLSVVRRLNRISSPDPDWSREMTEMSISIVLCRPRN
jgi:hypothetical protein